MDLEIVRPVARIFHYNGVPIDEFVGSDELELKVRLDVEFRIKVPLDPGRNGCVDNAVFWKNSGRPGMAPKVADTFVIVDNLYGGIAVAFWFS